VGFVLSRVKCLNIFVGLLDLIFPKTCVGCSKWGSYLCAICASKISYLTNQFCPECFRPAIAGRVHPKCQKRYGLDGLVSIAYLSFPVNKLIHNLKYRFTTDLIGEVVTRLTFPEVVFDSTWVLTPIPLHKQRQNIRGFNQSELLGKLYSHKLKVGFEPNLLQKSINTKAQVGLKREQRHENVKGVFEAKTSVKDKKIVVFDDVWTTGATIKNAAQSLKRSGAQEVWGLTLARSH